LLLFGIRLVDSWYFLIGVRIDLSSVRSFFNRFCLLFSWVSSFRILILVLIGEEMFHSLLLLNKFIFGFLEETDSEFVVNKGDDHIVVKRNHVRWNVIVHLLHTLHENEGTVGGKSIFASFCDGPALVLGVGNCTVVRRNCFQLNLNVSLHGSSD